MCFVKGNSRIRLYRGKCLIDTPNVIQYLERERAKKKYRYDRIYDEIRRER